ncbi:MAG: hypothetical protein Q4G65_11460 [bacterium]|nr:hypothetical protein [bacterium]
MTNDQIAIVLDLLRRNVRPESCHDAKFHEFHVLNEDVDGIVRRLAIKERERLVVLYGSSCGKVRALIAARRAELESASWTISVPSLNPGKDVAVWCQLRGEGREDWFNQREQVVVAVLRLWRTLKQWGLVGNDATAFRTFLEDL